VKSVNPNLMLFKNIMKGKAEFDESAFDSFQIEQVDESILADQTSKLNALEATQLPKVS